MCAAAQEGPRPPIPCGGETIARGTVSRVIDGRTFVFDDGREVRLAAAIEWYREGRVSQGKGAEIAGLSRIDFLDALYRAKVPACQVTVDELMEEVDRAVASRRERIAPDTAGQDGAA